MTDSRNPKDAPPSYAVATGSSTTSQSSANRLEVPGARNGIPPASRRSMEDEQRPVPEGWLRQWDAKEQHQFYVDTKANPPRSIWHHPYDDEQYLNTLTSEQRERLQEEERQRQEQISHSDDEARSSSKASASKTEGIASQSTGSSSFDGPLPPRPSNAPDPHAKKSFSDRLKEKVTGHTKEERAQIKAQREEEERQYYEAHMRFRECLQRAQMTGQPQFFAKDRDGKDIYIEPPNTGYGGGYGGYGGYGAGGYGYNPYTSGPYANPNARFIRPQGPYNRPYGPGYGGGYGLPIAGGLLGGMLLGGLLF